MSRQVISSRCRQPRALFGNVCLLLLSTLLLACSGIATARGLHSQGTTELGHTGRYLLQSDDITSIPAIVKSGGRVKAVSAGADHVVALLKDGTLRIWGSNGNGQRNIPAAVRRGVVKEVAAGNGFTVALMTDGSVKCWGGVNDYACLNAATGEPVYAGKGVIRLRARDGWVIAQLRNGRWLGYSGLAVDYFNDFTPLVNDASATDFAPMFLGSGEVADGLVLSKTGKLRYTGEPGQEGSLVVPPAVLQAKVSAVRSNTRDNIYAMARLDNGHLVPMPLEGDKIVRGSVLDIPTSIQGRVRLLACGPTHAIAVLTDGTTVAWGSGARGKTTVPANARTGCSSVAVGPNYSLCLKSGNVIQFGKVA